VNVGGPPRFADFSRSLRANGTTLWLGQSVDTSTIHTRHAEFRTVPILTSIGCVIRRPVANGAKFDDGLRQRIGAQSHLMVDSGGFVLMSKPNIRWGPSRVGELYARIDADHLVSLDIPPLRSDCALVRRSKYRRTLRNLEVLTRRFGERIVPVVHGVGLSEFEANCRRIAAFASSPSVIGIGGLVPTLQRCGSVKRTSPDAPHGEIANAIRCVRGYFPKSKVHLFGVGSLHTVLGVVALGVKSVDSIGWRQAAGFGSVYIPGRHRRLLTQREREAPCRPFASDQELEILAGCHCPACREARDSGKCNSEVLAAHFLPRAVHNIWVLYSEIAGYLDACHAGQGAPYLQARLSEAWLGPLGM
jgi:queuine/archaeosine tRNA-ribosyltransferase